MKVLVVRETGGSRPASETIIDPLCTQENICTARGKAFLYSNGFIKRLYDIRMPYRQSLIGNDLAEIRDGSIGVFFVSRVVGHSIQVDVDDDGYINTESTISVIKYEEG